MRRYDARCDNGHYFEVVMEVKEFRSEGHICPCGADARIVIRTPSYFSVDKIRETDYTTMAGPESRYWTSKKDRDAWLKRENRWIPDNDDPKTKEAFGYLDQCREEKEMVKAKGWTWEEYARDKHQREKQAAKEKMAAKGLSITGLNAQEAQKLWAEKAARAEAQGYTDSVAREFHEKWKGIPAGEDISHLIPAPPDLPESALASMEV